MPIYEYRSTGKGCSHCGRGFDVLQKIKDEPLSSCPKCGTEVKRAVSRFAACVSEMPEETLRLEGKLREYESDGLWSHAAELADKKGLQERAMDNYKKAGYNF